MQDSHLIEKTLSSEELFRGRFLHAIRDTVALPDGALSTREYIRHPGAVMVIPLLVDATTGEVRLVLERQYRHPVGQVMIEFPAGKLDPGEDLQRCAQRELLEETGYSAAEWAHAGVLHPVISYSTEFIDIWFARGLTLDVFTASPAELLQWCCDGRVTDAKTLTGALWVQNFLAGNWALNWQPPTDAVCVASS